ncbi:MAG: hypothetical protein MHM6MM_006112 [Cercozoa sp. M6MM]
MYRLLVHNCSQVVTVSRDPSVQFKVGDDLKELNIIPDGAVLVDAEGKIASVGTWHEVLQHLQCASLADVVAAGLVDTVVDAKRQVLLPGFCDGHTHACFAGDRVHEFELKLAGASYMEVHAAGGGIGYTVEQTAQASEDTLYDLLSKRVTRMLRLGTTLVEVKSGYGLSKQRELRMLRVIDRVAREHEADIVSNFCGAHSVPKGMTASDAADDVIAQLTQVKEDTGATLCDVFCETGVFERDDTERILRAATEKGMLLNFHGDELSHTGACEMAADLGARAVSHCEHVTEEGMRKMAEKKVAAVLLPTTATVLQIEMPPARALIQHGAIVALGSDFNPNAHTMSMPQVMHLACTHMRMQPAEALVAATLNAAYSMDREATHGSLCVGKQGDLVLLAAPTFAHVAYQSPAPISAVFKNGKQVFSDANAALFSFEH